IHVLHRFGALLVLLVVGALVLKVLARARCNFYRVFGSVIGLLLLAQIGLGISNVVFGVPLWVAVGHNFGGVSLLVSLVLFTRAIHVEAEKAHP
ncbi:MAG: COX15/CtaA family protein, partial [Alcanivoracaceae bacterium]